MYKQRDGVQIEERGWAGHFIMSRHCLFRRNTLISYNGKKWIVSTVGACINQIDTPFMKAGEVQEIGPNRYYETMAFESKYDVYDDINVEKPIHFESEWAICGDSWHEVLEKYNEYPDIEANKMHDTVVDELSERILKED